MIDPLYSPQIEQIDAIINKDSFVASLEDLKTKYPNESLFSLGYWSFMVYMGYGQGFLGIGGIDYSQRFAHAQRLSIPERNALIYAANKIANQTLPQPVDLGGDLFLDVIPDLGEAAFEGLKTGINRVVKIILIGVVLVATLQVYGAIKKTK